MPRRSTRWYPAALAMLGCFAAFEASAQTDQWKHDNQRRNRYEGVLQTIPNGGALYAIKEFSAVTDKPLKQMPSRLRLLYYAPGDSKIAPFQVSERVLSAQYLMVPILDHVQPDRWNRFEDWPVSDVILPNHVDVGNLAVLARIVNTQGADVVTPVILYGNDDVPTVIKEFRLDVLIYRALSDVSCDLVDGHGKVLPSSPRAPLCSKRSPGGHGTQKNVTTQFAIAAETLPVGPLTIRLNGKYDHDDSRNRLNSEIHFYNPPRPPH